MRKALVLAASALFVLSTAPAALAHHGPENIVIKAAQKKQAPVPFSHGKHAKTLVKGCDTCHHTQKGLTADKDADVKKCSTCHLDPKAGVPSMREMSLTKNPFHILCIDCHKTQKKGPTVCTQCHKK
jgi:hypothetical protein